MCSHFRSRSKKGEFLIFRLPLSSLSDTASSVWWSKGRVLAGPLDLYSPEFVHSGEIQLGRVTLTKGENHLRVSIISKNPKSADYRFGLDWIKLIPVRPKDLSK